jgi:hypothetical protein
LVALAIGFNLGKYLVFLAYQLCGVIIWILMDVMPVGKKASAIAASAFYFSLSTL